MWTLLLACWLDDQDTAGDSALGTCEQVIDAMDAELATIQACSTDDDCGQSLSGTSCGCTRNLVAAGDADLTTFQDLQALASDMACDLGGSTCDCPPAWGFACDDGTCTWNYVDSWSSCRAEDGDPYEVEGLTLDGNVLEVAVGYSGGCEEHSFTTCWPDQLFLESEPVQATLELQHDANGDACESYLRELVQVDLSPLAYAYAENYGGETGTVIVNVGEESVTWTFEVLPIY